MVQAVGMSPAAAAIVSEGNRCCLQVYFGPDSENSGDDVTINGNDITVKFRGYNCGTNSITEVHLYLEQSKDGGAWVQVGSTYNGNLAAGGHVGTDQEITDLVAGSYMYRLSGQYDCLGTTRTHNDPAGYAMTGPYVIS